VVRRPFERCRAGQIRRLAGVVARASRKCLVSRRSQVAPTYFRERLSGPTKGGITVTVCQDKAGTDESSRRAAEWVKENISASANPPVITEGGTVAHFSS
jgi:hypothetical protein